MTNYELNTYTCNSVCPKIIFCSKWYVNQIIVCRNAKEYAKKNPDLDRTLTTIVIFSNTNAGHNVVMGIGMLFQKNRWPIRTTDVRWFSDGSTLQVGTRICNLAAIC